MDQQWSEDTPAILSAPDPAKAAPPVSRPAFTHLEPEPAPRRSSGIVVWLLAMIIVLLVASVLVPRMVEETQYALSRGKQRADYELSGSLLQTASLNEISRASQLVNMRIAPSVVIIAAAAVRPPFAGRPWPRVGRRR
jgi:hypothetical protein